MSKTARIVADLRPEKHRLRLDRRHGRAVRLRVLYTVDGKRISLPLYRCDSDHYAQKILRWKDGHRREC